MIPAGVPEAGAGKGDARHDRCRRDKELSPGEARLRHV
jgi:hypothetical protein